MGMGRFASFLSRARGSEDGPPSGDPDSPTNDLAAAKSELRGNRKRISKLDREAATADLQRELDKLYTPENWKAISSMYFDARYVTTGDDIFRLSDDEQTTLGTSLAASARLLLKIDPGYIALIIFTANMGKLIAVKETQYSQKKKSRAKVSPPPIGTRTDTVKT
jgi:hypothetical protein